MSESGGGIQYPGPDEEEQLRAAAASVGSYPWPAWITLCWGLGVAFHWWDATRRPITPQAIQQEMDRMRGRK